MNHPDQLCAADLADDRNQLIEREVIGADNLVLVEQAVRGEYLDLLEGHPRQRGTGEVGIIAPRFPTFVSASWRALRGRQLPGGTISDC